MTARTGRTAAKQPLTPTLWILIVFVLILLVGAGFYVVMSLLGDEPPIRVRNGSMDIDLATGQWDDAGDAWSPSRGWNWGSFEVKVTGANGHACGDGQTGSGKEVLVLYSDKTAVSFKSTGSAMGKTRVQPKNRLEKVNPQLLRHGSEGGHSSLPGAVDSGFIAAVGAKDGPRSWSCEFKSRDELSVITICPTSNAACR